MDKNYEIGFKAASELAQPEMDMYKTALQQILWLRPLEQSPSKLVEQIETIAKKALEGKPVDVPLPERIVNELAEIAKVLDADGDEHGCAARLHKLIRH